MMDFITTSLQKKMISKSLEGFKVYLFGSSLHSSKTNDIDLLIEYDEGIINIDKALRFRIEIEEILTKVIKSEIDKKLQDFGGTNENIEEVFENREQIEISRYFEKLPKPTLIATQEFLEDKIYYRNTAKEKLK